jgi:hypothetical protein
MSQIICVTGPCNGTRFIETVDCDGETEMETPDGLVRYVFRDRLPGGTAIYALPTSTDSQVKQALAAILLG